MKKKPTILEVIDPVTKRKQLKTVFSFELTTPELISIQSNRFYTHLNTHHAKWHRRGTGFVNIVTVFCLAFIMAHNPTKILYKNEAPLLYKLFHLPSAISIPARLLTLILSLLGAFVTGILFGIPGKIMRRYANHHQYDISYLWSNKAEPPKVTLKNHESLLVCAYNTALLPKLVSARNGMRDPVVRSHEILKKLASIPAQEKPHILSLQEVFSLEATQILCDQLRNDYPFILYNVAPGEGHRNGQYGFNREIFGLSSGLLIASQFPILYAKFVQFPNSVFYGSEDSLANKGLLMVVTEPAPNTFHLICNSHLQSKAGPWYEKIRTEQLLIIKSAIEDYAQKLKNVYEIAISDVILAGDLNISRNVEKNQGGGLGEYYKKDNQFFINEFLEIPLRVPSLISTWTLPNPRHLFGYFPERRPDPGVDYDHIMQHKQYKALTYLYEKTTPEDEKEAPSDHLPLLAAFARK